MTATRKNHDVIMSDEFWDFLRENNVSYTWVFQFMPVGADASMDLVPTPEQRYERFYKTEELRLSGKFAFVADFWNHRISNKWLFSIWGGKISTRKCQRLCRTMCIPTICS